MRQQCLRGFDEADRVRQQGVSLERGFVYPFGVNRELNRFMERFEDMKRHAAGLGAAGRDHAQYFLAKLGGPAGTRFEANDKVDGQMSPRGKHQYANRPLTMEKGEAIMRCDIE
jgi:hypothetical protein